MTSQMQMQRGRVHSEIVEYHSPVLKRRHIRRCVCTTVLGRETHLISVMFWSHFGKGERCYTVQFTGSVGGHGIMLGSTTYGGTTLQLLALLDFVWLGASFARFSNARACIPTHACNGVNPVCAGFKTCLAPLEGAGVQYTSQIMSAILKTSGQWYTVRFTRQRRTRFLSVSCRVHEPGILP